MMTVILKNGDSRSKKNKKTWDIDVKEKIYQRLANEIFFRIFHGQYPLGAKLSSYQVLAKEAGSSPETVRKAVCRLQEYGVIEKNSMDPVKK